MRRNNRIRVVAKQGIPTPDSDESSISSFSSSPKLLKGRLSNGTTTPVKGVNIVKLKNMIESLSKYHNVLIEHLPEKEKENLQEVGELINLIIKSPSYKNVVDYIVDLFKDKAPIAGTVCAFFYGCMSSENVIDGENLGCAAHCAGNILPNASFKQCSRHVLLLRDGDLDMRTSLEHGSSDKAFVYCDTEFQGLSTDNINFFRSLDINYLTIITYDGEGKYNTIMSDMKLDQFLNYPKSESKSLSMSKTQPTALSKSKSPSTSLSMSKSPSTSLSMSKSPSGQVSSTSKSLSNQSTEGSGKTHSQSGKDCRSSSSAKSSSSSSSQKGSCRSEQRSKSRTEDSDDFDSWSVYPKRDHDKSDYYESKKSNPIITVVLIIIAIIFIIIILWAAVWLYNRSSQGENQVNSENDNQILLEEKVSYTTYEHGGPGIILVG